MKPGDLVRWTFAKTSNTYNPKNKSYLAILLTKEKVPEGSWVILLQDGNRVHADLTELVIINECG